MKYRKKPLVVVEAWHFLGPGPLSAVPPEWVNPEWWMIQIIDSWDEKGRVRHTLDFIQIPTPEGSMRADIGDWLIRGIKGEVYPCKVDIFEATYEPAPEPKPLHNYGQDGEWVWKQDCQCAHCSAVTGFRIAEQRKAEIGK